MARRLLRDLRQRVSAAGYHKHTGDMEVTGHIINPRFSFLDTTVQTLIARTLTPVKINFTKCEGFFRAVVLEWPVQYNLGNLDHYEIQVSDDGISWYSLKFDGTHWRDVLNATTDWAGNFMVHAGIPHTGAVDNPAGRALRYRLRQVTKAGIEGPWSDTSNATTKTVQDGDMAANIVYANNVRAGQIRARELAMGTDELLVPVYDGADALPSGAHLFDLSQPDCVSNSGLLPAADKEIVYAPPSSFDEALTEFDHPWAPSHFTPIKQGAVGVYKATTNLVTDPEDLTTAGWTLESGARSLSDYYIDGKRFTLLSNGATADRGVWRVVTLTGDTVKSASFWARKGTSTTSLVIFYDLTATTERGRATITWATKTVTYAGGAVKDHEVWCGDDLVWVAFHTASCTAANTHRIYARTGQANQTSYFTAIQAENSVYPTPYTPTTRAAGELDVPLALPSKFTAVFWVRPWFNFDTASFFRFLSWYIDGNNRFQVAFEPTGDRIYLAWMRGGTFRGIYGGPALDSAAKLNQWIMVAATVDLTTGSTAGSMLKVYYGALSGKATAWSGNIDAFTTIPNLSIGYRGLAASEIADSFLTDLMILPDTLLTEAQCDAHFATSKPWYSSSEVATLDRSVRIDRHGIRLHNAQINITDWRNRQIMISNRDGMRAKDAAGNVIHDIPDGPVLSNMVMGGHVLFRGPGTALPMGQCGMDYTDVLTSRWETYSPMNVALPPATTKIGNPHGAYAMIGLEVGLHQNKLQSGVNLGCKVRGATQYNIPDAFFRIIDAEELYSPPSSWPAAFWYYNHSWPALLPVVYSGGTPYITWAAELRVAGMAGANANYYLFLNMWLLGLLV